MIRQIFVNLPVKDLPRSKAFFASIGWTFNERFTNEMAACLVVSEAVSVMLLSEPFFQGFTKLPICDARAATECILALQCDTREEVKETVRKAVAAGATTPNEPQDHGFMLQHGFTDPDGHQWEVFFMDEAAAPAQM